MTKRGRPREYLRIEEFKAWEENHFDSLVKMVKLNQKLTMIILGAVIAIPTVLAIFVMQVLAR